LKKAATFFIASTALIILAGCNGDRQTDIFTVDFKEKQILTYQFVSTRDIELDWDPANAKPRKGKTEKFSESMKMTVDYKPVQVDPYGLTTIKAKCRAVKARRTSSTSRYASSGGTDAVESLNGKSFKFTVGPTGKIADFSKIKRLIQRLGDEAFRPGVTGGRIKDPDMIADFIATQWFLWDSISTLPQTSGGVTVGQSWQSRLSVPAPMVLFRSRDVTYTLKEIRTTEQGRLAVIDSLYSAAGRYEQGWPIPYSGRFQVRGRFGFITGYKVLELSGQGQEIFNIDTGQSEGYNQDYTMKVQGSLPAPMNVTPLIITVKQKLKMTKLQQ
jgi:hypothetical protein